VIGKGRYKQELTNLSKELGIDKQCTFMGALPNDEMENEIAKSAIALAPYIKELDTWTYYADPGKVKT